MVKQITVSMFEADDGTRFYDEASAFRHNAAVRLQTREDAVAEIIHDLVTTDNFGSLTEICPHRYKDWENTEYERGVFKRELQSVLFRYWNRLAPAVQAYLDQKNFQT